MARYIDLNQYIEQLLIDTLDGIIASELTTFEKINYIKDSINLDDEEFAKQFLTPQDIRMYILHIFPTEYEGISAIDEGQIYKPKTNDTEESPAILENLGYQMIPTDYELLQEQYKITKQGYLHLYEVVQKQCVIEKRILIKQLVLKGIPTLAVDKGELSTKVCLREKVLFSPTHPYVSGLIYKCYAY